jgi:hypothetical protein
MHTRGEVAPASVSCARFAAPLARTSTNPWLLLRIVSTMLYSPRTGKPLFTNYYTFENDTFSFTPDTGVGERYKPYVAFLRTAAIWNLAKTQSHGYLVHSP